MMATITRAAVIAEALTWLDTPWHHWACLKGVGVDCVRYPEGVAKALGTLPQTWLPPRYTQEWHLHQQSSILEQVLQELHLTPRATAQPGDLLVFQFGQTMSHLGFLLDANTLIHASRPFGKVVIEDLDSHLRRRLRATYAFPGVTA